ncbi:FadR/GntR family transcriptional regulator [Roseibium sp.]|uniref:FadR/GntR family transcriptional regulator n=1 Tax=Roseibium sp. TaxID=1936156 RepID=UPI003D0F43F2
MTGFRNTRRPTLLPDQIAADIMQKIADGELVPGDTLPTEHGLAETFGVSRNVVREAIARLRSDGAIETRQGRGTVVRPVSERETFRVDTHSLGKSCNLADLFELRGLLEVEAAGLAAERRGSEDLENLHASHARLAAHGQVDGQYLAAGAAFHRALGKASGNAYLMALIGYISSRLVETTSNTAISHSGEEHADRIAREHRDILQAVEAGDKAAARAAMAAHIQHARERQKVPEKQGR